MIYSWQYTLTPSKVKTFVFGVREDVRET